MIERILQRACRAAAGLFAIGLGFWAGCGAEPAVEVATLQPVPVEYATGFRLFEGDGFQLAEVTQPWPGATDTLRYLLVPRGAAMPEEFRGVPVVRTPVRRVVALSTTHLAMLEKLGLSDRVVGVGDAAFVYSPGIRARLQTGAARSVGEGEGLATETVAALEPDLVLLSSLGGLGASARMLEGAGVPVVLDGDWAENTPLGRAEWIRFVAAFFERGAQADTLVEGLARRYEALAARGNSAASRPTVFVGSSFQGTWHAPGGGSYMAALLRDAGAEYLWANTSRTGSLSLDLEAVLARAQHADVWLNPGAWASRAAGAAQDERYRLFDAFRAGRVYNYDRRVSEGGGYDFFETGAVEPDVLLADLLHIFHPDLLPQHELVYYRRVA